MIGTDPNEGEVVEEFGSESESEGEVRAEPRVAEHEFEFVEELAAAGAASAVLGGAWLYRQRAVSEDLDNMQSGDLVLLSDGGVGGPVPLWRESMLVEQISAPADWLVYARRTDNTVFF